MPIRGENITTTVNDITVSYNDLGPETAPAVIFIHGFPFSKKIWDLQAEALKGNYRVITYDIRGHGNTTSGEKKFSIETFAEDLICFMDKIGIREAVACGLSMGGYILLNALETNPERFKAMVLSGTQCLPDTPEARVKRAKAIQSIHQNGVDAYADESIKKLFSQKSFTTRKEEVRATREMICSTSADSLCKTLQALADRNDTCDSLIGVKLPALILSGSEDAVIPQEAMRMLSHRIENSVLHFIAHSGHLCNLENTHEFNEQLKKFVDSLNLKKESPGLTRQYQC